MKYYFIAGHKEEYYEETKHDGVVLLQENTLMWPSAIIIYIF